MANDKIIRFPGSIGKTAPAAPSSGSSHPPLTVSQADPGTSEIGPDGLTEDQRKAVQVVLSGMSFVLIGIKPTDRGADFFTSVHGDPAELRNAQGHLDGVIARAFSRKNI